MGSTFFEEYKEMYEEAGDTWATGPDDFDALDSVVPMIGNIASVAARAKMYQTTGIPPVFRADDIERMRREREDRALAALLLLAG